MELEILTFIIFMYAANEIVSNERERKNRTDVMKQKETLCTPYFKKIVANAAWGREANNVGVF